MHLCNACGVVEFGLGKTKAKPNSTTPTPPEYQRAESKSTTLGEESKRLLKKKAKPNSTTPTPLEYQRAESKSTASGEESKWLLKIKDCGGRPRTLCCHPFNAALLKYGKYRAEHKSDCGCPIHRDDTYWRRLSSNLLSFRNNAIKHKRSADVYKITGVSLNDYQSLLKSRFQEMYKGILSEYELRRSVEDLHACKMYTIDEWFPRCGGKKYIAEGKLAQARFFARVFSFENTQLLVDKNSHANALGMCIVTHKNLINNKKVGKILPEAELNFLKIEPSEIAVKLWFEKICEFNGA